MMNHILQYNKGDNCTADILLRDPRAQAELKGGTA